MGSATDKKMLLIKFSDYCSCEKIRALLKNGNLIIAPVIHRSTQFATGIVCDRRSRGRSVHTGAHCRRYQHRLGRSVQLQVIESKTRSNAAKEST